MAWRMHAEEQSGPRLQRGNERPCRRLRHQGSVWRLAEGEWEMSLPKWCYHQQDCFQHSTQRFAAEVILCVVRRREPKSCVL